MTEYVCEKCIHRYPKGGCLVPSNLGYVEQCKHFTEESKPKPMTNEEWLRSATFEEMAGAIYEWHSAGYTSGRVGLGLNPVTEVVEWLKQPHMDTK